MFCGKDVLYRWTFCKGGFLVVKGIMLKDVSQEGHFGVKDVLWKEFLYILFIFLIEQKTTILILHG
jgi:hypothetical protein